MYIYLKPKQEALYWYTVYGIQCHMRNDVINPHLRHILSKVDEQLHHKCHIVTLGIQVRLLISWNE
jgi:hypothetical protein